MKMIKYHSIAFIYLIIFYNQPNRSLSILNVNLGLGYELVNDHSLTRIVEHKGGVHDGGASEELHGDIVEGRVLGYFEGVCLGVVVAELYFGPLAFHQLIGARVADVRGAAGD